MYYIIMWKCIEIFLQCLENVLFDGIDDNEECLTYTSDKYAKYSDSSEDDSSEDDSSNYTYIIPQNNYTITRRNIVFC